MKKEEQLNKLVIIGNGFDLAHGLKTSYNDFILWYLNQCFDKICEFSHYKDDLLELKTYFRENLKVRFGIQKIKKIGDIDEFEENGWIKATFSGFLSSLIRKNANNNFNWIDLESEYYQAIIKIYEIGQQNKITDFINYYVPKLQKLNREFDVITRKLEEYLSTIACTQKNKEIDKLILKNYEKGYYRDDKDCKKVMFLNFNYTSTIENYNYAGLNHEINYIHGQLKNHKNPIIFGYGDEIDGYYKKFEELNINDFLTHFKSFGYFKTNNYQNLLSFIESDKYDVDILGHSCGLSDRVMLNTIFEHDNCNSLQIYYYQRNENENDFIFKTQEISRHFKDKAKFRERLNNFSISKPLIPFTK